MIILVGCLLAKKEKEKEKVAIMSKCNHVIISFKLPGPDLLQGLSASPHVSEHRLTSSSGNLSSEHHHTSISGTSCTQLQYIHNKLNVQPLQHGKAFNTVIYITCN